MHQYQDQELCQVKLTTIQDPAPPQRAEANNERHGDR